MVWICEPLKFERIGVLGVIEPVGWDAFVSMRIQRPLFACLQDKKTPVEP